MKTSVLKATVLTLFAVAIVAAPTALRADESAGAPASGQEAAPKPKKNEHATLPFHGKLAAIDKDAMTLTVGKRTFAITPETKITKDDLPATLADGVVGEMVGGAYVKNADGTLSATMIHFGLAAGEKKGEGKASKNTETDMEHGESDESSPPK